MSKIRAGLCLRGVDLDRVLSGVFQSTRIEEKSINGHPVIHVYLTDDMLITALSIGVRTRQRARALELIEIIKAGGEYRKDVIGLEGCLAFAAYMYGNWLVALDYVFIGKGDSGDLVYRGYKIDVKTGTKPHHVKLMVPLWQWEREKHDVYVLCNSIAEDWIRIWGFAMQKRLGRMVEKEHFTDYGYGPTIEIHGMELNDIHELKELPPKSAGRGARR